MIITQERNLYRLAQKTKCTFYQSEQRNPAVDDNVIVNCVSMDNRSSVPKIEDVEEKKVLKE
jgi:hypothetical protein